MTAYVLRDASEFEVHLVPAESGNDAREAMLIQFPSGWKMSLWSDGKFQIQSGNSLMTPGVELTEHNITAAHASKRPKRKKVTA